MQTDQLKQKEQVKVPEQKDPAIEVFKEEAIFQLGNVLQDNVNLPKDFSKAIESIGGEESDIKAGLNRIKDVNEEIAHTTEEAIRVLENYQVSVEIRSDFSDSQLVELRQKTKDDYGEGLVNKFHKGIKTLTEHESAQYQAYEALSEKIDSGSVNPEAIGAEINQVLNLKNKPNVKVETNSEIIKEIDKELNSFVEQGLINQEEKELIAGEGEKFLSIYQTAYSEVGLDKAFIVTRDNVRKLAFQTERDKQVFSGSDHGTRHILEGNMNMADKILDSLGDKVSAKDKVIIHQIIIDHDLGYTTGVAQAKKSFEASKDHPLFSTKFVEDNKDYYLDKFGNDAYQAIKDGILLHSYVKSEYSNPTDSETGINFDIIRSVTSTVDALGVTAETKCPAFFREPNVLRVLQKIKLYSETHDGKVDDEQMDKYKGELHKLADNETSVARKKAYHEAIDNQFNAFTVDATLGQYTGVLKDIKIVEQNGKLMPHIKMDISRIQALLGDFFGDKIAFKSFIKAMEDFNMPEEVFSDLAQKINEIRNTPDLSKKEELMKQLSYSQDNALFEFAPTFSETDPGIDKVFIDFESHSIRTELNTVFKSLEKAEIIDSAFVNKILSQFDTMASEKLDIKDIEEINVIKAEVIKSVGDPDKLRDSLKRLKSFSSQKEREYMNI